MAKKKTNWKEVEAEYRTTTMALREIARRHGTQHSAILRRVKKFDWVRDPDAPTSTQIHSAEKQHKQLTGARAEAIDNNKKLADRIRQITHVELGRVRSEQVRREKEARGEKVKASTGRPANLTKTLLDCATVLDRLVKTEQEIYRVSKLPPPSVPASTGTEEPGEDAAPAGPVVHEPVSLATRLGVYEHEKAIEEAKRDHAGKGQAGSEEKVVRLGGDG